MKHLLVLIILGLLAAPVVETVVANEASAQSSQKFRQSKLRAANAGRYKTLGISTKLMKRVHKGDPDAEFEAASLYDARRMHEAAFELYMKAATKGHAQAQSMVAFYYSNGHGVPSSDKKAVKWYQKAAEQGDPASQFNLALSYAEGVGIKQSDALAQVWLEIAAEQEFEPAVELLTQLRKAAEPRPQKGGPVNIQQVGQTD